MPAIGTITVSDRVRIKANMPEFQEHGLSRGEMIFF
jgi:hypothetical protein